MRLRHRHPRARRISVMVVLAAIGLALAAEEVGATVTPVGSMATARYGETATTITDGSGNVIGILAAGGQDASSTILSSAEFYDPATNTWTPAGNEPFARYGAKAVSLPVSAARPQGGVLVEGGLNANNAVVPQVDVYNRATNSWSTGGNLNDPRSGEALVRTGSTVLVIGGLGAAGSAVPTVERWNDVAGAASWTTVAPMATARRNLAATEIVGGRILVTGGGDNKLTPLASSEIYDPTANSWSTTTAPMATARYGQTATEVSGGAQVLVAGGITAAGRTASSELYTVATNTWASAGTMAAARSSAQAVAISEGLVEVVGGTDPRTASTDAESWSASDGWAGPTGSGSVEPLDRDRESSAVTFLGQTAGVLVVGGYTTASTAATNTAVSLFPSRPVPTPAPTPTPSPTPPSVLITPPVVAPTTPSGPVPVQGKTLVAAPVSGTVLIRIGNGKYVPLKAGQAIPVGAFLDTTDGHVTIIGQVGAATQSAQFWGGIFQVTQPASDHGQVDLHIIGSPVCPTATKAKSAKASLFGARASIEPFGVVASGAKAKAKPKKKPPPRLWGDGHGDFQTRGANSAATVRGTKWLVEERCTGTFTEVARGVVSVRDFARNTTFLLPAPRTYLARPKAKK